MIVEGRATGHMRLFLAIDIRVYIQNANFDVDGEMQRWWERKTEGNRMLKNIRVVG
jgi:hypothetical protein